MAGRTFAVGDLHGDLDALHTLVGRLPLLDGEDTLVFLGDYLDRGPRSREVVELVRYFDREVPCNVVALRGNHEDAWLRVVDGGFPEFVLPLKNGGFESYRSFCGGEQPGPHEIPSRDEMMAMMKGSFLPAHVVEWFRALPHWYEDEHALYVHAGLPRKDGRFLHPSEVEDPTVLLWLRTEELFREYRGKTLVIGHTTTDCLPPELSQHTPDDPNDLWAGEAVIAIDTGAGKGGFLTAIELPSRRVYESR